MNVDSLLKKYFKSNQANATIEVFDTDNIYNVYKDIVKALDKCPEIELSVLQSLSYCLYEVLDNVITHSTKQCGTVIVVFDKENTTIKILVADDGIGVRQSLSANKQYRDITTEQALNLCIQNSVTDGKGMGYGLYSTMQLIHGGGTSLIIHSEDKMLSFDGLNTEIRDADYWQGTLVYFEIHSNQEINPQHIFDDRVDVASDYDNVIDSNDDIGQLW